MTQQELLAKFRAMHGQQNPNVLKRMQLQMRLRATDSKAIAYAEGELSLEEWFKVKAERDKIRAEIAALNNH